MVLSTGTSRKQGVLGTGSSKKSRVLRTGLVIRTILVTDVAQKRVLGAYLLNTFTFFLSYMINCGVYSDRLKRGVLDTGEARKGGS